MASTGLDPPARQSAAAELRLRAAATARSKEKTEEQKRKSAGTLHPKP